MLIIRKPFPGKDILGSKQVLKLREVQHVFHEGFGVTVFFSDSKYLCPSLAMALTILREK